MDRDRRALLSSAATAPLRRRRALGALVALAFGFPFLARAEPLGRPRRVGVLSNHHREGSWEPAWRRAFMELMAKKGFAQGKEAIYEWRYAERESARLPALAAELVGLKLDALLAFGSIPARAAADATSTIPIVAVVSDAVREGYTGALGRPTGNVTGLSTQGSEVFGKFMQYLKALIPEMARLAILLPEGGTASAELAGHLEVAARAAGVEPSTSLVRTREEIVSAFATMQKRGILAAHCFARTGYFERHEPLVRLALDSRVALVDTEPSSIVRAGALMSYTAVIDDLPQRVAAQLEKVLRGMAVRDIPFEQFSKYALQINRTTAKALGITIPPDLMLRADEVID